jgi:hypothetical protein
MPVETKEIVGNVVHMHLGPTSEDLGLVNAHSGLRPGQFGLMTSGNLKGHLVYKHNVVVISMTDPTQYATGSCGWDGCRPLQPTDALTFIQTGDYRAR